MTIVVTGAGSGGHITPVLAVARELKRLAPDTKVIYIGQSGDSLGDIPKENRDISAVYYVSAGKLRRYHGEGVKQLFDVKTVLMNTRDLFKAAIGVIQSYLLLGKLRPDVIFIKGGYIGVPVGLGAALRHIPYITHDSDSIPGLANRIIARWAKIHSTAMPIEHYSYSPDNTVMVGVPVGEEYKYVDQEQKIKYRHEIGMGEYKQLIVVSGGGQGAQKINQYLGAILKQLLEKYPEVGIVQFAGRANEDEVKAEYQRTLSTDQQKRVKVLTFVTDFYRYSGAADIIVARAGATNLAEYAIQEKACIIIPNPVLTGGHQPKNAELLQSKGAVKILTETELDNEPLILSKALYELLDSTEERRRLEQGISKFAQPGASEKLANLLLDIKDYKEK